MDFARLLVNRTVEHVEEIDALIQRHAEHWRLDRMAIVDRNLLRLATQEFLYDKETPKTVVINEAIEIARRFSTQESPQFINGILDSIKREVEERAARLIRHGTTRSHSRSETEADPGSRLRPLSDVLSIHSLARAGYQRNSVQTSLPKNSNNAKQKVRVAGRILTNRPFGKAGFMTLSDGEGQVQVYAKKDQLPERDFQLYKLLDIGDFIGVEGTLFRTRTGELTVLANRVDVSREELPSSAREVAWPDRCRNSLPAPIRRSGCQSRSARRVCEAQPDRSGVASLPGRAWISRSRDTDPSSDRWRRAGEAVQDASQRARYDACTCGSRRNCT